MTHNTLANVPPKSLADAVNEYNRAHYPDIGPKQHYERVVPMRHKMGTFTLQVLNDLRCRDLAPTEQEIVSCLPANSCVGEDCLKLFQQTYDLLNGPLLDAVGCNQHDRTPALFRELALALADQMMCYYYG